MANKKIGLESKLRRLESLEGKGFFSKTLGDTREINELKVEIKEIEDALVSDKEYGCPSCEFSSNNKKDFNHVKGDTFHYCKDCIKKHNMIVKVSGGDDE